MDDPVIENSLKKGFDPAWVSQVTNSRFDIIGQAASLTILLFKKLIIKYMKYLNGKHVLLPRKRACVFQEKLEINFLR
jgi:hypothetical protein